MPQKYVQFTEAIPDVRWIGFVGFLIGLVELIQDGFAITVAGIEGMGLYVGFQPLGDVIHGGTSWRRRASLRARLPRLDIGVAGSVYSGTGATRGAPIAALQGTGLRLVFVVA